MEAFTEYGLISNLDFFYPPGHVYKTKTPYLTHPDEVFDKCVIYIPTEYLLNFVNTGFLSGITKKFKLVTGLSDYTMPYLDDNDKWKGYEEILNHTCLISWYGSNYDKKYLSHPKMHAIILGLPRSIPFPEKCGNGRPYQGWYSDPFNIQRVISFFSNLYPTILSRIKEKGKKRDKLLYINYTSMNTVATFKKDTKDFRPKLDTFLSSRKEFLKVDQKQWSEYIEEAKEYNMCLCPFGRGVDTYRFYESIFLGMIPVCFKSFLDGELFDLPVIIISDFRQITREYLEKEYDLLLQRDDYNLEKLTLSYWVDKIRNTN